MMSKKINCEFWFDPICPWAFMTSRWILEVAQHRDLEITWSIFSLAHLNKDRKLPEKYRASMANSWLCTRLIKAVADKYGQEKVLPIYSAISTRIHIGKAAVDQQLFVAALSEVGADPQLAAQVTNTDWDEQIISSHNRGVAMVGNDVGTPIIAIDGVGFFGPVISPAPKGEQAVKLWDGVLATSAYPGFFELKRSRTVDPIFE